MNYILHLLIYLNIYSIMATSLNMVVGYCGLMTLAHAGYFALGCYTYALASTKLGLDFASSVCLAFVVSAVLSLAISVPACRFKGDAFVLISLAVQQMLLSIFQNWSSPGAEIGTWANMTNGPFGISSIPKPFLAGIHAEDLTSMALLSLLVCGLCASIAWLLLSSPWARLLVSIRDDELATRGLGKNVRLSKIQAIAISCGMAAIAGCLYASYVNYVDPTAGSLDESMLILCMVLVGGIGNFRGPLVGALLLIMIPEILRFTSLPDSIAASVRLILYGILLVGLMHLRPQGIAGAYKVE